MDAPRDASRREIGGGEAVTARIGAAALPLGVVLIAISEVFHPSREDPMDFPAVFREYANSDVWTTVHLGEYLARIIHERLRKLPKGRSIDFAPDAPRPDAAAPS